MKKEKPEGVILWHEDGMRSFKAYDIFVRKDKVKKYKKIFDNLYKVDCLFAEVFTKIFKDYVLLGSEDDLHFYSNEPIVPKKFKVIMLCKHYPEDKKEAIKEIRKDLKKEMKKEVGFEWVECIFVITAKNSSLEEIWNIVLFADKN